jgi:hypothetical protein
VPQQEKLPENRKLFLFQEVRTGKWMDENPTGWFENVTERNYEEELCEQPLQIEVES